MSEKQRKRIGTLGTRAVQKLRKQFVEGLRWLEKNRYSKSTKMSNLPYTPTGLEIKYVSSRNWFMRQAKMIAEDHSMDEGHKTGAVIVNTEGIMNLNDAIISVGANGSIYHEKHGCERKRRGCKTGEGYELCEGCAPRNHAEQTAIRNATQMKKETKGCSLFLWGHFWACKPCCDAMKRAGITTLYLEKK